MVNQNYEATKQVHQNLGGRWTLDAKGQKELFLNSHVDPSFSSIGYRDNFEALHRFEGSTKGKSQ